MAEKDDLVGIIPLSERTPELESEVAYHVNRITKQEGKEYYRNFDKVTKKYKHIVYPEFKPTEKKERIDWEMEEIRRCIHGYDGMPGKYYYYFNHVWIKDKARGKIRPEFRVADLEWFKFLENLAPGKGIVCIKRRQVGMSWKAAVDVLHDCTFKKDFEVGMNSKTETDSRNLFKKVKYIHRSVPDFLRPVATATDRRDAMDFSKIVKDQFGNKTRIGTQSSIISVAPTPTAHAGNQYGKLIMDESGEVEQLMEIWANAEDCLMRETQRVGTPVIFGTVGDVDKQGKGIIEFWKRHNIYDLERFAFWGYNALIMDEYGNDDLENSIRWIIYTRKKKESGADVIYNKFKQKYPLSEADAFLSVSGAGVGHRINLEKRYAELIETPAQRERGSMRRKADGGVDFVPHPDGKLIVYERPHPIINGYISSCDPAEDDNVEKTRDSSNLATVVMKKAFGMEPSKMVVEYEDRPKLLDEYYEQLAMILQWYNNCKVNIELNKGGWRMLDYFENQYSHLLMFSPKSANNAKGGFQLTYGSKMTAEKKNQMMGLIDAYTENHCEWIPSTRLIEQFKVFGGKGEDDDLAIAFGWNLIVLQADKSVVQLTSEIQRTVPNYGYKKEGDRIYRVANDNVFKGPSIQRTKSALFK